MRGGARHACRRVMVWCVVWLDTGIQTSHKPCVTGIRMTGYENWTLESQHKRAFHMGLGGRRGSGKSRGDERRGRGAEKKGGEKYTTHTHTLMNERQQYFMI